MEEIFLSLYFALRNAADDMWLMCSSYNLIIVRTRTVEGAPCFSFDGCQVEVEEGEAGLQKWGKHGQTYESTYHEIRR